MDNTAYSRVHEGRNGDTVSAFEKAPPAPVAQRFQSLQWMILAWIAGLALAIGHHFFYARFDQQEVGDVSISQRWIVRIGTGMAFSVQTLFVAATSIACAQQQWLTTRSDSFKIRQIDTIFGVLGNPLALLESRVWFRHPTLLLVAVVAWLLPISAVITPAAINVVANGDVLRTNAAPRQLYFDPERYATLQTLVRSDYISPAPETLKMGSSSALTGQILPIPASAANISYTLDFVGPAVRCDPAPSSVVQDVYDAYIDQMTTVENDYRYISWVPTSSSRYSLSNETDTKLDVVSTDTAHIYIIPNTSVAGPTFAGGIDLSSPGDHFGYQDLLDCTLQNASYSVFFNFSYPAQNVIIESLNFINGVNVSVDIAQWRRGDTPAIVAQQAQRISYQSIMESFGRLLVGNSWLRDGFDVTSATSWNMLAIDWTSRDAAKAGLEQLFQNMTLSMLSAPSLTMNETVAEQNQVPVEIFHSNNIYVYRPRDLWLAYGIAAGAALLSMAIGIIAIQRNKGCYQTTFSTFIRVTSEKEVTRLVDPGDNGAEPVPKHLGESRLVLAT